MWEMLTSGTPLRDEITRMLETHPELQAALAARPTFTATLLLGREERYELGKALERAVTASSVDAVALLAAAVRDAAGDEITVDVSGLGLETRIAVSRVLSESTWRGGWAAEEFYRRAREPLAQLSKQWAQWLSEHVPERPPPPTLAEKERAERERMLRAMDGGGG